MAIRRPPDEAVIFGIVQQNAAAKGPRIVGSLRYLRGDADAARRYLQQRTELQSGRENAKFARVNIVEVKRDGRRRGESRRD